MKKAGVGPIEQDKPIRGAFLIAERPREAQELAARPNFHPFGALLKAGPTCLSRWDIDLIVR